MSYIADSRKPGGPGIWPLQHKKFDSPEDGGPPWDLHRRGSLLATRVLGRDDYKKGGLGSWILEEGTTGDVVGGQLWKAESKDKRKIPMWRFAYPVAVATEQTAVATPGGGQQAGDACAFLDGIKILPILKEKYGIDDRMEKITPERPEDDGKPLWPKFPVGYYGISLPANIESRQVDLFMPTDPRMIAMNRKGDAAMGSWVVDMGENFKIDPERFARLQSMMRVVFKPTGCVFFPKDMNALAWQIGPSGCADVRGGLMFERRVIGPPDVPTGGGGGDGAPVATPGGGLGDAVNYGGRNTTAPFFFGPGGSIAFNPDFIGAAGAGGGGGAGAAGAMPPPPIVGKMPGSSNGPGVIGLISVFDSGVIDLGDNDDKHQIGTDADGHKINASHVSTNAFFKEPGTQRDAPLEFGGAYIDPMRGRYLMPVYLRYDPRPSHPFACGPRKGLWRWESECCIHVPEAPPPLPGIMIATQFGPLGGAPGDGGGGGDPPTTGDPGNNFPPTIAKAYGLARVRQWQPGDVENYAATEMAMGMPAWLGRPQNLSPNAFDLRKPLSRGLPNRLQKFIDINTPVTGRIEAFGTLKAGRWSYNQKPGRGRFNGGISGGGFALLPPELDMADYLTDFARNGITESDTYFVAVPGTYWGAGFPDPTTGSMERGTTATLGKGYRWGVDTAGELSFQMAALGTFANVFRLSEDGVPLFTRPFGGGSWIPSGIVAISLTVTDYTNGVGAEQTIRSVTIPANFMADAPAGSQVDRGIRIKAWGTFDATATNKTARLYFGGTLLCSNDVTTNPTSVAWELDAEVYQKSASLQEAVGESLVGAVQQTKQSTQPTENESGSISVLVTGQAGAANTITIRGIRIEALN